ncbi:DNA repair protein RecN [Gordonia amicalis]|uniref:DNA repair protein RecN n=1 Tax=Gordonia amicalis TaxID=89053 RepID=A0ABU4DF41_9ACTN|nr:DNA repair protein RecN [Gordonia amicalis]MDJ0453395.1 DNA repair protein RecN [Gordonia amicalis]MDV6308353.1 DNA repair protein RecN [Gordonia amicalis]MDV7076560.1 DNA repair protein RecN [Gordonia amicalis]MDV7099964.1 DNA repair protein RecN [Gordonia amicalis]UKO94080.1 DNA repair protein RecN [Gordonia amicalis]
MLEELSITGLGVIEDAQARFHPGFTVLTGETGAGKTMIVTSLHLLSGARADATRVRTGSAKAIVEGRFRLANAEGVQKDPVVADILDSTGAELDDDDTVIAVRSVSADGRSRAHLGGRSVPVGVMGQLTTAVLAIHGQNDQLRLLRPEHQRAALDTFGGSKATAALEAYRKARTAWVDILDELDARRANYRELAQEADRLRFGIDEIAAVDPVPGEDEELTATIRRLSDLESIRGAADQAHDIVAGDSGASVIEGLGTVRTLLEGAADDTLRGLVPRVSEALTLITDVGAELTAFTSSLPADAEELDKLLARQAELKSLLRKYAPDVDGVIDWRHKAQARLAEIEDPRSSIEELETAAATALETVEAAATKLHDLRVKAASSMAGKVSKELKGLAMGDSTLAVSVSPEPASPEDRLAITLGGSRAHAGADGADKVEFALVAHPGATPLPIAKSASGGELSRVMLALEVVLAAPTSGSVMVFDEVDAGVGGRAAVEIGKRLSRLARAHQVIVVTHLPQVAAFADNHLVIGKSKKGALVTSSVRTLDRDERVAELARMLAGLGESDTGRAHAEELLATAEAERAAH